MEKNCDVAPSAAAQNDMKQLRQLGRLELALGGLINRRSRETLAIALKARLAADSFPQSLRAKMSTLVRF